MEIVREYLAIVDVRALITIAALIVSDLVLGVILALKKHEFEFQYLAAFVCTTVFPWLGGYFVMGFLGLLIPEFKALVIVAAAFIAVSLTSSVLAKLRELGLPVPERLTR